MKPDVNPAAVATLLMQQADHATCIECCSFYKKETETANCGHSLCALCWRGRRECPTCGVCVLPGSRSRNVPLETFAILSQSLAQAFENLFDITVDECVNFPPVSAQKDGVTNSIINMVQSLNNQFAITASVNQGKTEALHVSQVVQHRQKQKNINKQKSNSEKVIKYQPQDDWDKIEVIPDSEEIFQNRQNFVDTRDPEDPCNNLRRSSRNKDLAKVIETSSPTQKSTENMKMEKKSNQAKKNWNNVKRMKREFNRLNKNHRSKLNVSIESIRKLKKHTKSTSKDPPNNIPDTLYDIDENSPNSAKNLALVPRHSGHSTPDRVSANEQNLNQYDLKNISNKSSDETKSRILESNATTISLSVKQKTNNADSEIVHVHPIIAHKCTMHRHSPTTLVTGMESPDKNCNPTANKQIESINKVSFFKKGYLHKKNCAKPILTTNTGCQSCKPANVHINIKTGNTTYNLVIDRKNEFQMLKHATTQADNSDGCPASVLTTPHPITNSVEDPKLDVNITNTKVHKLNISSNTHFVTVPTFTKGLAILPEHTGTITDDNNIARGRTSTPVVTENSAPIEEELAPDMESEDLDIFISTSPVRKRGTVLNEDAMSSHIRNKRERAIAEPLLSAKRVRLNNHSQTCGQGDAKDSSLQASGPEPYSENVFTLDGFGDQASSSKQTVDIEIPLMAAKSAADDDVCVGSVVEETPDGADFKRPVETRAASKAVPLPSSSRPAERIDHTSDAHRPPIADAAQACETPITLKNFFNELKHNSTPLARKSLRFERAAPCTSGVSSPDATLFPTECASVVGMQNKSSDNRQPCVAGSNLKSTELAQLKMLCTKLHWKFSEKYTPELTHLVVTVDHEYKVHRTIKYMCALAAGLWVVSFTWAERCATAGGLVPEEPFEAVDLTGEPGPRRSRTAACRLFTGFTFHCVPPFAVLDVATLKDMLEASGGRVVQSAEEARASRPDPHLVLAETALPQSAPNRFTYMALKLCVVPVNVEWVINSLGCYTLLPLRDMLLCPAAVATRQAAEWLPPLLDPEPDSDLQDDSVPPSPLPSP